MSSISVPTIRYTLRACTSPLRLQRRWARVHDVRFVATNRDKEQVIERYKEKLQEKAKKEGLEDISQLQEAYKDKISQLRKKASTVPSAEASTPSTSSSVASGLQQPPPPVPKPQTPQQQAATSTSSSSFSSSSPSSTTKPTSPSTSSSSSSNSGTPGIKPLSSYVDLEKISALPNKEIEYLWRLRFSRDPLSLVAVIPLQTYQRIYQNARTHPQFILPLPRPAAEDGSGDVKTEADGFGGSEARTAADIHFLQWGFYPAANEGENNTGKDVGKKTKTSNTHISTVLFTHLAAFKLHGAYAQPHTTVTHHLDLADSHGIVLLQGSVVEGRGVSPDEATWLLMCLQKFYDFEGHGGGIGREKRQGLLEKFSKGDAEGFKIEELMDEAERVS